MSAADLEALALAADDLRPPERGEDGEFTQPGQVEPQETPEDSNAKAIGFALAMLRELTASDFIFRPGLRTLRERMPDEVVEKIARPWATVATHYGVDLGRMTDRPEILAIMTTGPLLWGIGRAMALELRERKPVDMPSTSPDSTDAGRAE